ncbi:hypothetical protein TanjilG_21151 [Lupinus angustifolius]|uniref:Uncharacterized protein n=1 Tax=Lupinus angustifolius TaxID=3871 RepID=A0A1J7HQU2_LUPAN|nr:hypothetical protein TanjilG_21151 [Lupinus angustifolius]
MEGNSRKFLAKKILGIYLSTLLLKKADGARAWKLTAFQCLDFSAGDVLDSLEEDNIIRKGGADIVYKGAMPNKYLVAVKGLPSTMTSFVLQENAMPDAEWKGYEELSTVSSSYCSGQLDHSRVLYTRHSPC